MDCKRAKGLILSEYADGELEGAALEELVSHIRGCSSCRSLAEGVTSVGELFKMRGRVEAPQAVWNRIHARISGAFINKGAFEVFLERTWYGLNHLRPAVMATAAIIIILFTLATAGLVSQVNYSRVISARSGMADMISLNGDNGISEYEIGTSVETFFL